METKVDYEKAFRLLVNVFDIRYSFRKLYGNDLPIKHLVYYCAHETTPFDFDEQLDMEILVGDMKTGKCIPLFTQEEKEEIKNAIDKIINEENK